MLVRKVRKQHKLTQMKFSKLMGISQSALSRMEIGEVKIDRRVAIGLHKHFKVSPKEIISAMIKGE